MKKGFTLIELLAVILILGIIALIASPVINGILEKAKLDSIKTSSISYINTIEKKASSKKVRGDSSLYNGTFTVSDIEDAGVLVSGNTPTDGWVKLENGHVTEYVLNFDEYSISSDLSGDTVVTSETTGPAFGGTIDKSPVYSVADVLQEGLVGVAYFDPTNLRTRCDSINSKSYGYLKTGCMKWYIFAEDDNSYTMILAHNITIKYAWDTEGNNVAYEDSLPKKELDNVVKEYKWKVSPRMLTFEELATITGSGKVNTWYYFDDPSIRVWDNYPARTPGASRFGWLYENSAGCIKWGCSKSDDGFYGYWIQTPSTTPGRAWYISNQSCVTSTAATSKNSIRPVVTLDKSILE